MNQNVKITNSKHGTLVFDHTIIIDDEEVVKIELDVYGRKLDIVLQVTAKANDGAFDSGSWEYDSDNNSISLKLEGWGRNFTTSRPIDVHVQGGSISFLFSHDYIKPVHTLYFQIYSVGVANG